MHSRESKIHHAIAVAALARGYVTVEQYLKALCAPLTSLTPFAVQLKKTYQENDVVLKIDVIKDPQTEGEIAVSCLRPDKLRILVLDDDGTYDFYRCILNRPMSNIVTRTAHILFTGFDYTSHVTIDVKALSRCETRITLDVENPHEDLPETEIRFYFNLLRLPPVYVESQEVLLLALAAYGRGYMTIKEYLEKIGKGSTMFQLTWWVDVEDHVAEIKLIPVNPIGDDQPSTVVKTDMDIHVDMQHLVVKVLDACGLYADDDEPSIYVNMDDETTTSLRVTHDTDPAVTFILTQDIRCDVD